VEVAELWAWIRQLPEIEGVTFSGGEPFEQSESLAALARLAHAEGMNVVSYSGYRYEALQANQQRFAALLAELDLLIDGEFRADQAGSFRWRGSGNQRLIRLTNRIELPAETDVTEMQITLNPTGSEMIFSGILSQELMRELRVRLEQQGFPTQKR
jgi:anaerobic ribonucleoside-triphosphate reductase activating protein